MNRAIGFVLVMVGALTIACSGDKEPPTGSPAAGSNGSTSGAADGRLALVRDQRLMVRDANGEERMLLRTPPNTFPTFPQWTPDGMRIAYVQSTMFTGQANADWGGDIYTVEASGGDPKLVLKHDQPGAQVQGLAWTPDGNNLLFGYQLTLIKDGKYEGQVVRIERLELASGKRTTVVEGGLLPSLNRDGSRLSYVKQDDTGKGGLFVSGSDGSGARQLIEVGGKFLIVLGPQISPDGSAIAFSAVATQAAEPRQPNSGGRMALLRRLLPAPRTAAAHGLPMDVWKVTVADGATARLTNINEDEPYPVWTPDGAKIIFVATNGLYEVNADGSNLKKLGPGAFGGQADVK
jgi:Tol biopolymer transport system component